MVSLGDRAQFFPDAVLDRFAFSGTPGQVTAQVEALFEAGATRVEFGTPHGVTPVRGIDLLGRRVLPAVLAPLRRPGDFDPARITQEVSVAEGIAPVESPSNPSLTVARGPAGLASRR